MTAESRAPDSRSSDSSWRPTISLSCPNNSTLTRMSIWIAETLAGALDSFLQLLDRSSVAPKLSPENVTRTDAFEGSDFLGFQSSLTVSSISNIVLPQLGTLHAFTNASPRDVNQNESGVSCLYCLGRRMKSSMALGAASTSLNRLRLSYEIQSKC